MAETSIPLRINWVAEKRIAHGYLLVTDDALNLVCLRDESLVAAAAGKAAGRQLGLVGALISAGVSTAREAMRATDLQALYDAQQLLPVEQRLKQHPLSRSVTRAEVVSLQTGAHLEPSLVTTAGPLHVNGDSPGVNEAIAAWCGRVQVPVVVVPTPKFPWKIIGGLVAAPFALALVYAVICIPFAFMHRSAVADDLAKLAEFKSRASKAAEAVGEPVGTPLLEACGDRLTKVPIERQLSWVGKLPPDALRIASDPHDFPRFTSISPSLYRFDEPKFDLNAAEPRWKQEASFGQSFERVFWAPSYWSELSTHTWVPQVSDARLLLVAKVQSVDVTTSQGQATMTVRVVDLTSNKALCEGELLVDFPPDGRSSSVGLDFLMSQALPLGLMLPGCGEKTDGLCKDPTYYARLGEAPKALTTAKAQQPATKTKEKQKEKAKEKGLPAVSGGDLRDSIRAVVKRDNGAIRACYENALLKQPGLTGKVTVKFVIAGSGAVSAGTIESSTLRNAAVEQCVQGRVMKWVFPAHSGGPLAVAYPFVFNTAN
jgi:hypothetical protein